MRHEAQVHRPQCRASRPLERLATLSVLALALAGCRPSESEVPLPKEDDLAAYSRAVIARSRAKVPEERAMGLYFAGRVEERFGREDTALKLFAQALDLDPGITEANRRIGFILSQRSDRIGEAIEAYQRALRSDPSLPQVQTRIGLILMHQNKLDDAEAAFQAEIGKGTADENTYFDLGQTLALKKRHEEAVTSFKKALDLDPNLRMTWYALAQSLLSLGRTKESEEALSRFRGLKSEEDTARVDPKLGSGNRVDQLRYTAETWVDAAELFLGARNVAATTLQTKPEDAEARDRLRRFEADYVHAAREALRFDPLDRSALQMLFVYHQTRGEHLEAGRICVQLLQHAPTKQVATDTFETVGKILESLGSGGPREDESLDVCRNALEGLTQVAPTFVEAKREFVKLILFRLPPTPERMAQAVDLARAAIAIESAPELHDLLAFALYRQGKLDEALATLEEALRLYPDDPKLAQRMERLREAGAGKR